MCHTHKTAINAKGVTGSNLFAKGAQNLRLRLGSVEVVHTFLVVPRNDSFFHVYDGIPVSYTHLDVYKRQV